MLSMSHDSDPAYRCPKCGATAALLMPEPIQSHVALKCLECAHVLRMPRESLQDAVSGFDSTSSLE
jgi:DNA-directed RNA polymerase subunit RPC12/RpoP